MFPKARTSLHIPNHCPLARAGRSVPRLAARPMRQHTYLRWAAPHNAGLIHPCARDFGCGWTANPPSGRGSAFGRGRAWEPLPLFVQARCPSQADRRRLPGAARVTRDRGGYRRQDEQHTRWDLARVDPHGAHRPTGRHHQIRLGDAVSTVRRSRARPVGRCASARHHDSAGGGRRD